MKNTEIEILINKNNALTDGSVPGRSVITNKVLNAVYHQYQHQGKNIVVKLSNFLNTLNMAYSGTNFSHIEKALDILKNFDVEIRNFEYQGHRIILGKTKLITYWGVEVINKTNCLKIEFSDRAIEYMKHTDKYTEIDLVLANKFKSKYGIVLFELYKRYENWKNYKGKTKTKVELTLEQMNSKFGTDHKYNSKLVYAMKSGIKEFELITNKKIEVKSIPKSNLIHIIW
jgi:hypothetical protein